MLSSAGDELFMTTDYTDLGLAGTARGDVRGNHA